MRIGAVDIGGTSIKSGVYENNELNELRETETEAKLGGGHVMERTIEILRNAGHLDRIGVSTAGQVDSVRGIVRYANENIPGYTGMEIKKILEQEFGVPVSVENDVNAAALGEAHFGAGREFRDFLCLTYGTGIGGAIVIDREVYRGSCFSAGEFGAIPIHASERRAQEDMFSGCYERYASTTALVKKAMELDYALSDGRRIFQRIGESAVQNIVNSWIREIVHGLTVLIHIFNPSCIIIGGGVMKQKYIAEELEKQLYCSIMESDRNVMIKMAELGNTAGLLGAVHLAGK